MIQTQEKPLQTDINPHRIYELALGFAATKTLLVAQHLGLFEILSKGGKTSLQIAEEKHFPALSLEMLLNSAVSLGLCQKQKGIYTNTPLSEAFLVPGRRGYLGRFLDHFNDLMYPVWSHLEEAVKTGHAQVAKVIGDPKDGFFQAIDRQGEALETFMQTMEEHSLLEGAALAAAYDFTPHRKLLDVAGGTGAMSVAIAERYSHLELKVFDRPPVVKIANASIQAHGLAERITTQAGDFFKDSLPVGADVVLLSAILHNWGVPQAQHILQQCHRALPSKGTLLISEQVLNNEKTQPTLATLCSLNMLIMLEGAQEYSEEEFRSMLEATGFRLEEVRPTGSFRQLLIARRL